MFRFRSPMTSEVASFADRVSSSAVRVRTLVGQRATEHREAAEVLDATLDELSRQHEELLVAQEELQAQCEELNAATYAAAVEQQRYATLFAASPDALLVTDAVGTVVNANPAAADLFGLDMRRLIGKPLVVFADHDQVGLVRDATDALVRASRIEMQVRMRARKGATFWASVRATCVEKGSRLLWIIRDITEQRQAHRALHSINAQLEAMVQERTVALEMALVEKDTALRREQSTNKQLQVVDRAKDQIFAVLSHDLRNPIGAILGWVQLIRTYEQHTASEVQRALGAIERSCRSQLAMIEQLLDVTRLATHKVTTERTVFDFAELVESCIESQVGAAREKGLELSHAVQPAPCPVRADRAQLERVVGNLLSNALKFTEAGGHVAVAVERDDSHATLHVADTGCGIDAELLPHVFDKFRQGSNQPAASGLGLGLYIVRELVEAHGGTVVAASDGVGRGAKFSVHLPLEIEMPPSSRSRPSLQVDSLLGERVLLVVDEAKLRERLRSVLHPLGAEILPAPNDAATLVELLDEWQPHVVVLGTDARTATDTLRTIRECLEFPVPAALLVSPAEIEPGGPSEGIEVRVPADADPLSIVQAIRAVLGRYRLQS